MNNAKICAYKLKKGAKIELIQGPDGLERWMIRRFGLFLSNDGQWELAPISIDYDINFLKRCQYDTAEDAYAQWESIEGENSSSNSVDFLNDIKIKAIENFTVVAHHRGWLNSHFEFVAHVHELEIAIELADRYAVKSQGKYGVSVYHWGSDESETSDGGSAKPEVVHHASSDLMETQASVNQEIEMYKMAGYHAHQVIQTGMAYRSIEKIKSSNITCQHVDDEILIKSPAIMPEWLDEVFAREIKNYLSGQKNIRQKTRRI